MDTTPISKFLSRVRGSVADNSFVLLRLRPAFQSGIEVRLITINNAPSLSFSIPDGKKILIKNFPADEGIAELSRLFSGSGSMWLETTAKSFQLVVPKDGRARLVEHRAMKTDAPERGHNREKSRRIGGGEAWLAELDLTDENGRPKAGRGDKLRQIERYADLLGHFAADCGWKAGDRITVADVGCGKGYLTFAAWQLLRRSLGINATVIGIDVQPELVAACEAVAKKIGAENISFRAGKIEDAGLPAADALIALHACNDATDAAIRLGVEAGAKLIIVAPCCHKDVRRALENAKDAAAPLAPVLEHGIFKERFSEWLTDGLRVLALEAAGYRVRTAEFIAAEHTPKNLLIGAVRGTTETRRRAAAEQFATIKTWAGLGSLPVDGIFAQREFQ
jgi:SAM-dependent methyltransferase